MFLCPAGAAVAVADDHRPVVRVDPDTGAVHVEVGGGAVSVDTGREGDGGVRARVRTGGTTVTASRGPGGSTARVETRHCPRYESTVSGSVTEAGARGSVSWRHPCGARPAPPPKPAPRPYRPPAPPPVRRAAPPPPSTPPSTPPPTPAPEPTPPPSPSPAVSATARARVMAYAGPPGAPVHGGASLVTLTLLITAPAVLAAATLRPQGGGRRRAR